MRSYILLPCCPLFFHRENIPLAVRLHNKLVGVAKAEASSLGGLIGKPSLQALHSDLKVSTGFDVVESLTRGYTAYSVKAPRRRCIVMHRFAVFSIDKCRSWAIA